MNDNIGMMCQVLSPSGLPRNRKWVQIDVGISFVGKRNYLENMYDAVIRQVRLNIKACVHNDVVAAGFANPRLYYGTIDAEDKKVENNYEGYEIFIWEVLYEDQIKFIGEDNFVGDFCKCKERYASIEIHKINSNNKYQIKKK